MAGFMIEGLAQQDAMYTQYFFNHLLINPAYSGSRDGVSATAFYRNQWTGFEGAPQTFSASVHTPAFNRVGLGLTFEGDLIGPLNNYQASLNYAYHIPLKRGKLSAGLRASVTSYNANFMDAETIEQNDPSFQENVNRWLPNFGAGIYYYNNRFVIGVGIPRLLSNRLNEDDEVEIGKASKLERHYYATAGIVFDLNPSFKLRPSFLIKYLYNAPLEADLGVNLIYRDRLWIGAAYRTGASWNANVSYQINKNLKIGYAFDFTTTTINQYSSGTHEIMLGFDINDKSRVISPRYF